ncbi:hypothetical protein DMENIID0001_120010 [Sergentomyia squamirostris]
MWAGLLTMLSEQSFGRKHRPEKEREDLQQQQQHLLLPEVSNHHHHFRAEDTVSKMQHNDLTFSGKFSRMEFTAFVSDDNTTSGTSS